MTGCVTFHENIKIKIHLSVPYFGIGVLPNAIHSKPYSVFNLFIDIQGGIAYTSAVTVHFSKGRPGDFSVRERAILPFIMK